MRNRQLTPDTKSQHSQPTKEREAQRATAQEDVLATQQDPLTQVISPIGSAPSAKVHANLLSRATSDYPARGRQLMLQMQRQYGNRYVQRVVELSRQGLRETEATPEVEATIEQTRGGGRSLDAGIQRQMESAFGTNFSEVRVHTDSTADALNQSLSARAFTTGQDIFFRQGEYNPGSSSGKELLAHELTHVVQQTGTVRGKLAIGEAGDRYEQEADKVASEVLQRLNAESPSSSTGQSGKGQQFQAPRHTTPGSEPAAMGEQSSLPATSRELKVKPQVQRQEEPDEELQAKPSISALQRQEEPDEELQAKPSISALQRSPLSPELQPNIQSKVIQPYRWSRSTPLTTLYDFFTAANFEWEGFKDIVDPRRWRMNPLNIYEGLMNMRNETYGGNYHSSSRHGAHNTVRNAMNRLANPSTMLDFYNDHGNVPPSGTQGRFNSEAWESFSWRKAKELFENDIGVNVDWIPDPIPANQRSTWIVCLNHQRSDVGISQAVSAPIQSVSGVRVAINYIPNVGGGVRACNGQMYPTQPIAPGPGQVRNGHPAGNMNGTVQNIPYQFLGYFGI